MKKCKEAVLYLVFGGLTTLINIAVYNLLYYKAGAGNVAANTTAWIVSVLFAFFTNRVWVFESNGNALREGAGFFVCRAATGALDLLIMLLAVDVLLFPAGVVKLFSNVAVIVLNYVLGKLCVFRTRE